MNPILPRASALAFAVLTSVSLSSASPQTSSEPTTLVLLVQGGPDGLTVTAAIPKPIAFRPMRSFGTDRPEAWVEVVDRLRRRLSETPLDLSAFHFDRNAGGQPIVAGDTVREGRVATLVKIPDHGSPAARVDLYRLVAGKRRLVGSVTDRELERMVVQQPLGPTVQTHLASGPVDNRYDIVVIGDGYTASQESKFRGDVDSWIANLFGKDPYKDYKQFFNVHSVFSASRESGADQPDKSPPIVRDTVYDASYNFGNTPRCLYIRNTQQAHLDAAFAPDVEGRIVVFVNDSRYGGCAGTFSVSYNGSSGSEVQSHEFGHSFGGLADEYDYGQSGTYTGPEPGQANVTADSTGKTKWPLWLGFNGVGVYEGARYYKKGLYRPKPDCLMRSLSVKLCEICSEELIKRSYLTTFPIESPKPDKQSFTLPVASSQTFSFSDLVPKGATITWWVDDVLKQTGGTSFAVKGSVLGPGRHGVRIESVDPTTAVRKGKSSLTHSHTWTVTVVDSSLPDLVAESPRITGSPAAGAKITVDSAISNLGASKAENVRLEHFLSQDDKISTDDIYLGATDVASLAVSQRLDIRRTIQLPFYLQPGTWYLASWLDREDRVRENDKTNNVATTKLTTTVPSGCPTELEIEAKLRYPQTSGSLSIETGGASQLVLTAPCHRGHWALVLWTCRGTQPGQTVGSYHLPLNWDPLCTAFGLSVLNTAPFYYFFDRVGLAGQTRPLVFLPPKMPVKPFSSNFAAILFHANFSGFSGTTNAVDMDFVK